MSRNFTIRGWSLVLVLALGQGAWAADFFVDGFAGNDGNAGTVASPKQTITNALATANTNGTADRIFVVGVQANGTTQVAYAGFNITRDTNNSVQLFGGFKTGTSFAGNPAAGTEIVLPRITSAVTVTGGKTTEFTAFQFGSTVTATEESAADTTTSLKFTDCRLEGAVLLDGVNGATLTGCTFERNAARLTIEESANNPSRTIALSSCVFNRITAAANLITINGTQALPTAAVSFGTCTFGTATGTGTVSSSGTTVTGVGTRFLRELAVGDPIVAGGQTKTIATITDNTSLTTTVAFSPVLAAGSAFTLAGALGSTNRVLDVGAGGDTIGEVRAVSLTGCSFLDNSKTDLIEVDRAAGFSVTNSVFSANTGAGQLVEVNDSIGVSFVGNTVIGSTSTSATNPLLDFDNCPRLEVRGLTATDNDASPITFTLDLTPTVLQVTNCPLSVIRSNTFANNAGPGIVWSTFSGGGAASGDAGSGWILNNVITGNNAAGASVTVGNAQFVYVQNNTIVENGNGGLALAAGGAYRAVVQNNILAFNGLPNNPGQGGLMTDPGSLMRSSVEFNLFWQNLGANLLLTRAGHQKGYDTLTEMQSARHFNVARNLVEPPGFVNYNGFVGGIADLRLLSASKAKGAGNPAVNAGANGGTADLGFEGGPADTALTAPPGHTIVGRPLPHAEVGFSHYGTTTTAAVTVQGGAGGAGPKAWKINGTGLSPILGENSAVPNVGSLAVPTVTLAADPEWILNETWTLTFNGTDTRNDQDTFTVTDSQGGILTAGATATAVLEAPGIILSGTTATSAASFDSDVNGAGSPTVGSTAGRAFVAQFANGSNATRPSLFQVTDVATTSAAREGDELHVVTRRGSVAAPGSTINATTGYNWTQTSGANLNLTATGGPSTLTVPVGAAAGIYEFTLTVKDSGGFTSSVPAKFAVGVHAPVTIDIVATGTTTSFATIDEATDVAQVGSTITIPEGIYEVPATAFRQVFLGGMAGIQFKGAGATKSVLLQEKTSASATGATVETIACNDLVFEGLGFRSANINAPDDAFDIDSTGTLTIKDCTVWGHRGAGTGIDADKSVVTVTGTTLTELNLAATVRDGHYTFKDGTVKDSSGGLVLAALGQGPVSNTFTAQGNTVDNVHGGDGISATSSDRSVLILNNVVRYSGDDGIEATVTGTTAGTEIRSNTVHHNLGDGVDLDANGSVRKNTLAHNGLTSSATTTGGDGLFVGVTTATNGTLDVRDNALAFNSNFGLRKATGSSASVVLDFNVIFGNQAGPYFGLSPNGSGTSRGDVFPGDHAIFRDPLFANPDADDYTPLAGSPLVGGASDGSTIGVVQAAVAAAGGGGGRGGGGGLGCQAGPSRAAPGALAPPAVLLALLVLARRRRAESC
ncbi:MAG: right-handed parallel beta-helix repeat-containing protein [Planctomycetes bacterium]|nr:right-handed parallel beta-helix repeat-containing protein [Planctomycetota bacterium]